MSRKPKSDPPIPLELIDAAKSGDRLETLIALRDLLALRLQESTCGRDVSSMARRLMQCVSEIETLEREKKALEDRGFDLNEFRKKIGQNKMSIQKGYKLNSIDSEHEKF